jgi:hypothetical protein
MKRKFILGLGLMLSLGAQAQNKLHVDAAATGSNNGTSWTNAYTSLSIALLHADTALSIDTIVVAEGTYYPEHHVQSTLTSERLKALLIRRSNLAVIGGYAAGGTTYNPNLYKAVVSGNIGNQQDSTDNSHKLLYIIGPSTSARLQNINIQNLEFRDAVSNIDQYINIGINNINTRNGGAIFIKNANTVFNNISIKNNLTGYHGGGIDANDCNLHIHNSDISYNTALSQGGGISTGVGNLIISNTQFRRNIALNAGGGIYSSANGSNIKINNCVFDSNYAQNFAHVIRVYSVDTAILTHNKIINHKLGAPMLSAFAFATYLNFSNNLYANNIDNNVSSTVVNYSYSSLITLSNSTYGLFFNNTFVNNKSNLFLHNNSGNITCKNNIFYNNELANTSLFPINTFTHNYVQYDSTTANNLNGNLNPMFVKFDTTYENGDFRLQFCSPLWNAGDTSGITEIVDLMGNPRIAGSNIDLGAYEKQSDDILANNAALATANDNGIALLPTCEENDWTYYAPLNNPDSIVMAIKWNAADAAVKEQAVVTIQVDGTHQLATNNTDKALATLPRYWNINTNNLTIDSNLAIKFYYSDAEFTQINNAINALGTSTIEAPVWFAMDENFVPASHVSIDNINNGNIQTITGTTSTINGINVIEFANMSSYISGGAFVKANIIEPSSIDELLFKNTVKLAPNPTNGHINIAINNPSYIGKQASIVDMFGKTLQSFEIKANNTIDCSNLANGMYLVQFDAIHSIKFVKQ